MAVQEHQPVIDQSVLATIRKIMKLRDGATSEGEAAACAARIADICLKHNLEIGSVQLEQDETEASEAEYLSTGVYQTHYVWLQSAVKGMFNVGSYSQGCAGLPRKTRIVFYGLKTNVESANVTFEYLLASVEAMLQGWKNEGNKGRGSAAYRAFRIGCAERIDHRALHQVRQQRSQVAGNTECAAIVLLGNKLIAAHEKRMNLRSRRCFGYSFANSDAHGAGYAAGGRVDLHGARSSRMLS